MDILSSLEKKGLSVVKESLVVLFIKSMYTNKNWSNFEKI